MVSHSFKLRLSGRQHAALYQHLYPGDGREAVAVALCGVGTFTEDGAVHRAICVHQVSPIPHAACPVRRPDQVTWSTEFMLPLLHEAQRRGLVILKIHSHPTGYPKFSAFDDQSDRELFTGLSGWLDTDFPGLSAIMLPDGRIHARVVDASGTFSGVASVAVAGPDIRIWYDSGEPDSVVTELTLRTVQAFGQGTTNKLKRLSIGVVGVSGTGSPVVEMLYRLGVGTLVLVDGDHIEEKNLGRIYNATMQDAHDANFKVNVQARAIAHSGLPTVVVPIEQDLFHPEVVRRLSQCDVIFGCMDSVDGRELLNRLCTYYSIPYFDLGVRLDADGDGNVNQVCGTVHYLQPDGSSLLSRKVFTSEQVRAAGLRRTNPEAYQEQVQAKYLNGVKEDRPAVITVNTSIAALALNDFLARIHPFRDHDNDGVAAIRLSLSQSRLFTEPEGDPCTFLARYVGRGDVTPLLNLPTLSERRTG